jgi:hypothetical protein
VCFWLVFAGLICCVDVLLLCWLVCVFRVWLLCGGCVLLVGLFGWYVDVVLVWCMVCSIGISSLIVWLICWWVCIWLHLLVLVVVGVCLCSRVRAPARACVCVCVCVCTLLCVCVLCWLHFWVGLFGWFCDVVLVRCVVFVRLDSIV